MATSTPLQIIKAALSRITAYQPGDQFDAVDVNDALTTFQDLVDSYGTDHAFVFSSLEAIVNFTAGQYQYTIGPGGDFSTTTTGVPILRPNRITNGFTRFSGIDFPMETMMDQTRYSELGLKNIPGPWPIACYYNPTFPLGTLYFYPNPSSNAELHLWIDIVPLSNVSPLTLVTPINMPPGYARAFKWLLAQELCSEYGFPLTPVIKDLAKESLDLIKSLDQVPAATATYDNALLAKNRANASWILTGGF